jgi:hypothetical protein
MKLMFKLVDTSGKELAECLEKTTADGKLPQIQYCCKMHWNIKLQKLKKFQGYKMYINNGKLNAHTFYQIPQLYLSPEDSSAIMFAVKWLRDITECPRV